MYYYYLGAHRAPLQEVLKGDGEGVVLPTIKGKPSPEGWSQALGSKFA